MPQNIKKPKKTFNSLFGILFLTPANNQYLIAAFNSLFGIPNLQTQKTDYEKGKTFNSLFGIPPTLSTTRSTSLPFNSLFGIQAALTASSMLASFTFNSLFGILDVV